MINRWTHPRPAAVVLVALVAGSGHVWCGTTFEGPLWNDEGTVSSAMIGSTVSTAGDVNGDGLADVIVGNRSIATKSVYVYFGSEEGLASAPDWTRTGAPASEFGASVATAGDVNGDGFDDVVIGAPRHDEAYVYYGRSSGLETTPRWTGEGINGERFGESVSGAGDVNGDGFDDVLIGAPNGSGRVYLYFGSLFGLLRTPGWTTVGAHVGSDYGKSVAAAGDVNGDGFYDVIVGSSDHDADVNREGAAFVFYGSSTGLASTPDWTVLGDQALGQLGWATSTAGDVNGDGYDDILVAAPWYDTPPSKNGKVYLYLGSATGLAGTPAWTANGAQSDSQFGRSLSALGDMNGDGMSDVVIGEPGYADNWGRVVIYLGGWGSLLPWPQCWFNGFGASRFGESVATAGNIDGFAHPEFVVGAPEFDGTNVDGGAVYLFGSRCGDKDGDGYIDCFACNGPGTCGDCDDRNRNTYPGALEVHDGQDNQCVGDPGFGFLDEISGDAGFHDPADEHRYSWPEQTGAASYEVARSAFSDHSSDCVRHSTGQTHWVDPTEPGSNSAFFYLVRSTAPFVGSWGFDSEDRERAPVCP
jgi:hypothetical protein